MSGGLAQILSWVSVITSPVLDLEKNHSTFQVQLQWKMLRWTWIFFQNTGRIQYLYYPPKITLYCTYTIIAFEDSIYITILY